MKLTALTLPALLLLAGFRLPVMADQDQRFGVKNEGGVNLRQAVEAHRASQREEVRREESAAGRRLTAAELAELREQVRSQWAPHADAAQLPHGMSAGSSVRGVVPRSAQPASSTGPSRP